MINRVFLCVLFVCLVNQIKLTQSKSHHHKNVPTLGCRDDHGNIVDWFYVYKLPEDRSQLGNDGLNYYFMTSSQSHQNWTMSFLKIDDKKSMAGRTISQIYHNSRGDEDDIAAVIYNDEVLIADGSQHHHHHHLAQTENGHTKGVIGANNQTGFWLIHSVPKYPPKREEGRYEYPSTAKRYGQSFLCITMDVENLNIVGKQLIYNEPTFYSLDIPDALKQLLPNFNSLVNGAKITVPPYWNLESISSLNGTDFKIFAKTGRFGKEIYKDWVAPTLDTDMLVESWLNGPGKLNSDCSLQRSVFNVAEVKIGHELFSIHHDHSKWAVSSIGMHWICVGDINREEHQKYRGGGTVCQSNEIISDAFRDIVSDIEPCAMYNII